MRPTLESDFFAAQRPRVIAHRGASSDYPENTIPAFRAATELGVPYIELDVHMTRDGEVVVSHDENLRRATGKDGEIADLTYSEVASADAGFEFTASDGTHPFRGKGLRIPRLADVLSEFADRYLVVEVKQTKPTLVAPMLAVIDRCGMRRRVLIASEHQNPLDEVRAAAPGIPTSFSGLEVAGLLQAIAGGFEGYRAPADALQVPPEHQGWKLVSPEIVGAAHRFGAEVHVWTVNEISEMRVMLALGADGIITDYPARMLEILQ
jgi:glycerophosphoryl diester phosphodiesterase